MIKQLTVKIVAVVLGSLFLVFAAMLLVLNLSAHTASVKSAEEIMLSVVDNDGFLLPPQGRPADWTEALPADQPEDSPMNRPEDFPPGGSFGQPNMMRAGHLFYVRIGPNGELLELNLDMMFDFTAADAQDFLTQALNYGKEKGDIDSFHFMAADKPYGQIIVFMERSIEMQLLDHLTQTSLWAAGLTAIILAFVATLLAQWMAAPIKSAFDRQRRFISDASHELKTPLTVISANVDVLQHESGDNLRLFHIKSQVERMSGLVHGLLTLARTDEGTTDVIFNEFNLSTAILNSILEFESRAFEEGKQYSYEVEDNLLYRGDEKQLKQLVGILIDNAIRYSGNDGLIKVTLRQESGRISRSKRLRARLESRGISNSRLHLSVYNTGTGVSDDEQDKIFERFYRSDESRSRETGGYGIGLSIAKAIATAHKGKISVSGEYGQWVRFDVLL